MKKILLSVVFITMSSSAFSKVPYDMSGGKSSVSFNDKFITTNKDFANALKGKLDGKFNESNLVNEVAEEIKIKNKNNNNNKKDITTQEVVSAPSVIKQLQRKTVAISKKSKSKSGLDLLCRQYKPENDKDINILDASLGKHLVIPVSRAYLNKIDTPFESVQALSNSKSAKTLRTGVDKSVLMLSVLKNRPFSMYLQDRHGNTANATFIPCSIPPQTIVITHKNIDLSKKIDIVKPRKKARRWEENSDYVSKVSEMMLIVAKGTVPTGYEYHDVEDGDVGTVCKTNGLKGKVYQIMEGDNMRIAVFLVSNRNDSTIHINEKMCYTNKNIMGVSAYPRTRLEPGQFSELFVIMNKNKEQVLKNARTTIVR